jgi:DeoR family suf operon transcriptional repressor
MEPVSTALPGYRGLRADLLVAIKKLQPVTAKALAAQFSVSTNAIRRHLEELQGDGLLSHQREIRGVGGPAFAYALTDLGEALFPRAYASTLAEALVVVREQAGDGAVTQLFERQWDRLAEQAAEGLAELPIAERAQLVAELLSTEGYMAEATVADDGALVVREHNCAVRDVAAQFPEVCDAELRFMSRILGAPVQRRAHMPAGSNCCEYCVGGEAAVDVPRIQSAKSANSVDSGSPPSVVAPLAQAE